MIWNWILAGGFVSVFVGLIVFGVRNTWVYNQRIALVWADYELYKRLPSYDGMMAKWWIWDAAKFIDMPDRADRKAQRAHARGEAIVRRFHGTPTHD